MKKSQGQHQRIYIRRSIRKGGLEGSKQKWWRIETQASEAKGPFPGGKRVGSWGKKKSWGLGKNKSPWTAFHGTLVLNDES